MNPSLLPSLAWFAHIARHGSFTRAAEEMGVSRAALSQNLKSLERQLGVRLLYRTTRDMSLTEAGQQLLDTLQPTLSQIEHAVRNLAETGGAPAGLIRVNTSRLAAKALLEPHLAEFYGRYPQVRVELIMDDTLSNIIADGCDVGIRLGHSLAEHVVAVPISSAISMVVVGSPAYFERHGVPGTPEDLIQHNCINYRNSGSGALRNWNFNEPGSKGRYFTQSVAGNFTTNDDQNMTRAAVQGVGLIQHVDIAIQQHLADGSLVQVLRDWAYSQDGFYLYSPSREQMPSKVRVLLDFLKEKREVMSLP
ncbi:LysR family transcriptional regulator [Pseudomonas daroniae]|uniref:LysR family transcriptional regulator n=1 Tax=Phytopseudomonas daroniae TaxID=2487519 RepID=A0A4Q9QS75_9GAMM|nr:MULTISPECIES: LysR family transcriptional regulator [Pseudomonas]TBU83291.1 LysR family transcriptional regulator [Pseudomonas daroniae]TBU84930.1 LysR family transcriptional regulator [Pseudomonas sp. FRB 228]TBU93777.1 LysR family transcriptional regulator [Pseudomonas daroniae]